MTKTRNNKYLRKNRIDRPKWLDKEFELALEYEVRKLREIERHKTNRAMWYECRSCGERRLMWLEQGLETHDENHKPVPFGIRCPDCGDVMYHVDWDKDINYCEPTPIPRNADYFKNADEHDCGIPVFRNEADATTIDIVRCKDCKHIDEDVVGRYVWCCAFDRWEEADWFCADGERKGAK